LTAHDSNRYVEPDNSERLWPEPEGGVCTV
jgi:hypothetical protein